MYPFFRNSWATLCLVVLLVFGGVTFIGWLLDGPNPIASNAHPRERFNLIIQRLKD